MKSAAVSSRWDPPRSAGKNVYGLPLVTLALASVSLLAYARPEWSGSMEDLRRLDGQLWRLLTGHLAHGRAAHLLLNLALFIPLASLRERKRGSRRFALEYACLATCVALGVRCFHSGADWVSYRGLSGVVYGLLALSLLDGIGKTRAALRYTPPLPSITLVVILTIKTLLEVRAGGWLVDTRELTASLGVRFLPGSHLGGLIGGAALAAAGRLYGRRSSKNRVAEEGSAASTTAPMTAIP